MLSMKQLKSSKRLEGYKVEREGEQVFIRLRNGMRYRTHGQYSDNLTPDMNDAKTKKILGE